MTTRGIAYKAIRRIKMANNKQSSMEVAIARLKIDLLARQEEIRGTPFFEAVRKGYYQECIVPYVEAGQSLDAQDDEGNTPLMVAMQSYADVGVYIGNADERALKMAMIQYLLGKKMDINIVNLKGKSAIEVAVECGMTEKLVYTVLCKHSNYLHCRMALETAIKNGDKGIAELLTSYLEDETLVGSVCLEASNESKNELNF